MAAAVLLSAGCASIVSKSKYPLTVKSTPENASISITDKHGVEVFKGQTPAVVRLKSGAGFFSKAEYHVKFSAPGYSEKIIPIRSKLNGWYFGNIVFGGLIGLLIIDPATGAMYKIDAKEVNETLNKSGASAALGNSELKIIGLNEVPASLKSSLVRIN